MKKMWIGAIALLSLVSVLNAESPVWIEATGVVYLNNPMDASLEGNVLIDVTKRLQVRATLLTLELTHEFHLLLSNGARLDALFHFFGKGKASFYGVGGFSLITGGGATVFAIHGGPGIVLIQNRNRRMKLFLEGLLNFITTSGASDLSVFIRAGLRFR
ncbi:MAG: hypothetical protein JXO51_05360 [Candidatus Aminicenantes bacterium]|nr:hypothetical protein [Candidatus Aminicenantes bacterium]